MGRRSSSLVALVASASLACGEPSAPGSAAQGPAADDESAWLAEGDVHARFTRVARQLRGFDAAMVEVGYRYTELYWALRDKNWGYARYQIKKMQTAIDHGLERRPRRRGSAELFLTPALARLERSLSAVDHATSEPAFAELTAACNGCHAAEQVGYIRVVAPTFRVAPVGQAEGSSRVVVTAPP
jgi:hypothetical protein